MEEGSAEMQSAYSSESANFVVKISIRSINFLLFSHHYLEPSQLEL